MPSRPGNWQLLHHSSDPIGGDPDKVAELVTYYAEMADTIISEAATLKQVGDGDDAMLKGEAADALRKESHEVAESLQKASGRYVAIAEALKGYQPELQSAMDESARALADAEAAESAHSSSLALPDPSANRPKDAPPLTDQETQDVAKRTAAIDDASNAAAAAAARLENTLSALNAAGQRATSVIKSSWKDGLHDTLNDRAKYWIVKIFKVFIQVLMWIGIALSALAFFIPGLGFVSLLGVIATASSFVMSTTLAALGEGSWLDVILGAVSLIMLGGGAFIAKIVQNGHVGLLGKIGTNVGKNVVSKGEHAAEFGTKRADAFGEALDGKITPKQAIDKVAALDKELDDIHAAEIEDIMGPINKDFPVKPQFWDPFNKPYWKNDWGKITDIIYKGDWKWDRLLSVDRALKVKALQGVAAEHGITGLTQPIWHYGNGGRVIGGWIMNIHKVASYPDNAYHDSLQDSKSHLMTDKP